MDFVYSVKKTSPGQYQTTLNKNQSKPIFQVLKVGLLLIKILRCGYQFFYVLLSYISFYIRGYPFLQIVKNSFNLIWKYIFIANFPFYFIDSPKYQYPFMLKSVCVSGWVGGCVCLCVCVFIQNIKVYKTCIFSSTLVHVSLCR